MKLGALIREIYDNAGPIYTDVKTPAGGLPMMVQISKSDFVKSLRSRYGNTQAETGFTICGVGAHRYLDLEPVEVYLAVEPVIAPDAFEDVSAEELAREVMDDDRVTGETERTRLIAEAAMRRKKGIADATAFIDRNVPRPAYMVDKLSRDDTRFEDQAAA
jgi:hypothetical protein